MTWKSRRTRIQREELIEDFDDLAKAQVNFDADALEAVLRKAREAQAAEREMRRLAALDAATDDSAA